MSPVTIGVSLLAVSVAGGAIYVSWSLRTPTHSVVVERPEEADPIAGSEPRVRPALARVVSSRAARRAGEMSASPRHAPIVADVPVVPDAAVSAAIIPAPGDAGVPAFMRHRFRAVMAARRRFKLTARADEAVFETLKLDGDTRLAIRRITAANRLPNSVDSGDDGAAAIERVEAARRGSIESLLGPERAQAFFTAERAATDDVEVKLQSQRTPPDPSADSQPRRGADAGGMGSTLPRPVSSDGAPSATESSPDAQPGPSMGTSPSPGTNTPDPVPSPDPSR